MAAPVLDPAFSPTLGSVLEGATNPAGVTVADLVVDGSITDPDGTAVEAIAIEAVNTSLGTWQYSLDNGLTWLTIRAELLNSLTNTLGLLLGPANKIRLLPFGDLNGTLNDAITFRAWDMTSGAAGEYVVTTPGSGAFSAASDTASLMVTPVNDAPTFATASGGGTAIIPVGSGAAQGKSITVQADGKILVAGSSKINLVLGFAYGFSAIRLNTDGTLDSTFGSGGKVIAPVGNNSSGESVTTQADGKILIAGYSSNDTNSDFSVIRLNANGTLDNSFGTGGKAIIPVGPTNDDGFSITVQTDGRILVAGMIYSGILPSGSWRPDFCVLRLKADGGLDTTFGSEGKAIVPVNTTGGGRSITVQADGKILVGGSSGYSGNDFSVIRLNANGTLDNSFGTGGKAIIPVGPTNDDGFSITVQADGRVLLAGFSGDGANGSNFSIIRLNINGTLDTSFGESGKAIIDLTPYSDYGYSVSVQTDGRIVVAGFSSNGLNDDFSVIRLNANGTLDNSFGTGGKVFVPFGLGNDYAFSVAVQTDGRILVAGSSDQDFSVCRLNVDGSLDPNFNASAIDTLGGTVFYNSSGATITLDSSVSIFDQNLATLNNGLGDYSGSSITFMRHGGASADDVFSGQDDLVLDAATGVATLAGMTIGSFTQSGGALTILFNANATQSRVNQTLSSIRYQLNSNSPPSNVQIDWIFSDGNSGAQGTGGALIATGFTNVLIQYATLSIAATSAEKAEGQSGTTAYTFTVTRSGDTSVAHTANWAVSGAAVNATDFVGGILPAGTVSFAIGETSKIITVNVAGDTTFETDEAFTVTLSTPSTGATIATAGATVTIRNDDAELSITATSADKAEGNSGSTPFTFTIKRTGDTSVSHTANWAVSGTEIDLSDFVGVGLLSGVVSFAVGETSKLITINVAGDTTVENDEAFTVTLSNPSVGATIATASATGTIRNDDASLPIVTPTTILWQNSQNGDVVNWTIENNFFKSFGFVGSTGGNSPWQIEAQGNFDSTPGTDIVWKNKSTGAVFIWDVANNSYVGGGAVGAVGPASGWEIVTSGYFNNDQYSDLLWQNALTSEVYIWNIENNVGVYGVLIGNTGGANSGWQAKATGEFDGKGNSDIIWQNKFSGDVYIWNITNNQVSGAGFVGSVGANSGWEIKDTGYFNDDAYSDILWQNSITGDVFIWDIVNNAVSGGGYVGSVGSNSKWDIQNTGLYNADSFSDILWHNSATGEAFIWNITNNAASGFASLGAPPTQWGIAPVNSPIV